MSFESSEPKKVSLDGQLEHVEINLNAELYALVPGLKVSQVSAIVSKILGLIIRKQSIYKQKGEEEQAKLYGSTVQELDSVIKDLSVGDPNAVIEDQGVFQRVRNILGERTFSQK